MSTIDQRLSNVAQRVSSLDLLIDPRNPKSLIQAKDTLQSIVNELQLISSIRNKNDLSQSEMIVLSEIDELLNHTNMLKEQIDSTIAENRIIYETINSSTAENVAQEIVTEELLNQEDIRKLLLLVAKAQSLNILTTTQKGLIKDQICRRANFLKMVLVEDLTVTLSALKEVGTYLEQHSI